MTDGPTPNQLERSLGRLQQHDHRSLDFKIGRAAAPRPLHDVTHRFHGGVRQQANIGACTYFALGDYYSAEPTYRRHERDQWTNERCFAGYALETQLDDPDIPGQWFFDGMNDDGTANGHGDDTGSSSIGMWRTAKQQGVATRVEWALGLEHTLEALLDTPISIGIPWKSAMFTPDPDGLVHYTGDTVGGHQITIMRMRVKQERVLIPNHWGADWGVDGWFAMTFDDLGQALEDGGDASRFYR